MSEKAKLSHVNGTPILDVFAVADDDDDDETTNFRGATLTLSTTSSRLPATPASHFSSESSSSSSSPSVEGSTAPLSSVPDDDRVKSGAISSLRKQTSSSSDGLTTTHDPAKKFFAVRVGAFDSAVEASRSAILNDADGELLGAWLLTEIDHWDTEKERLLMLTNRSLLIVKYDFIALAVLEYRRLALAEFDRVVVGNFTYPQASVVPKVDKLVTFVKGFVWSKLKGNSKPKAEDNSTSNTVSVGLPSLRRSKGVRIMWNKGSAVHIHESWNPWSRNIPFVTFTSHPLAVQSDPNSSIISPTRIYDIEHFVRALVIAIESESTRLDFKCRFEEKPIIIQNYLGLTALFYNVNNLGFFKSRGRFSF